METPILNVDLDKMEYICARSVPWFNPNTMQSEGMTIVHSSGVTDLLKEVYPLWDVPSPPRGSDYQYDANSLYSLAPPSVHCLESFLTPESEQLTLEKTSDYVSVNQQFHYVLLHGRGVSKENVVGFVKGSFYLGSAPELDSDADDEYLNTIQVGCNIEAIEFNPNFRGLGLGKHIVPILNDMGYEFYKCALDQIPVEKLEGVRFEPVLTSDLHSQSGARWMDHFYECFETTTFELLTNYVEAEQLEDAVCDASL